MSLQDASRHRSDLIGIFAQHRVAANLLMLMMLLAGVFGLLKLNTQFLPTFALDFVTVRVVWPGASAEDVTRSITTPLEQELDGLDYVKEMRSTSSRGSALIVLEYEEGSDIGLALDQVKDRVANVRNLPTEAEEPQVSQVARYEDVATLILTSRESLEELRPLAYAMEAELLDRGIARVEFSGLPEQMISIEFASEMLSSLGLSLPQIGQRIVGQSQDAPAGTMGRNQAERELRSLEKRRSTSAFEELTLVSASSGERITLGDVAEIRREARDDAVELRYQDHPAVLMRLLRTENADTLKNAQIFNDWYAEVVDTLPPSVSLHPFSEPYLLLQDRIGLLLKNGLGGLVLVVAILFIFLNGRVAFWVTIGIPVSFAGTLGVLYLVGGSINMVSLFALIMALGIIVDDAIVVGEDALTHYQTGEASLMAAEGGARRMFVPVMSSSLTTIAAFLPLLMIGGIIGNILQAIPVVIICVIIASLIESFLILPGHLRHTFHAAHHKADTPRRQRMDAAFNRFRDKSFRPIVRWSLANRRVVLVAAIFSFFAAIAVVAGGRVPFTFFPSPDGTFINASVKFTAGTLEEKVHAFAAEMEDALYRVDRELADEGTTLVQHSIVHLNTGSFDGGRNYQGGRQYATVQVELLSPDAREVLNTEIIRAWQAALPVVDGIEQLSITSPRGGPPGSDVDVFLTRAPPEVLKQAALQLSQALTAYAGVSNIQDDLPYGQQQYIFKLTPAGESLGFTVQEVGRQLRAAFDGELIQLFFEGKDEIEVRVRLNRAERDNLQTLHSLPLITPQGAAATFDTVVQLESRRGLEMLRHTDGRLGIHVRADVDPAVTNANQVIEQLEESILPALVQRYNLRYTLKGKAEEQGDTAADMKLGAMIGLTLMYVILAWVFGSYLWPLAVMAAIPFGLTGAIFGHWLMGLDLTILSLFGFFGLSGIVVNDSIILVTFYQELREQGQSVAEALQNAACLRLRAVLLTSLTTIAGLLPLLFETSLQAQFLIPMAVSISFGLAFATVLVLVVIPSLLSLIEGFRHRFLAPTSPPTPNAAGVQSS